MEIIEINNGFLIVLGKDNVTYAKDAAALHKEMELILGVPKPPVMTKPPIDEAGVRQFSDED